MLEYMNYIGDVLLIGGSVGASNKEGEILCKLVKARDQKINEKVLKIVCKGLAKGILKDKLFPLLSLVLDSDKQFASANI